MNCSEYRQLYSRYTAYPLPRKVHETQEFDEWQDHSLDCRSCADWDYGKRVEATGHTVGEYPCVHIAYQVTQQCETHPDPYDCPDVLIVEFEGTYGIPIRDGGSSRVVISHCPWCGLEL